MKESMWGYAILVLGVTIISFMLLVQNLTSTSEEDFYLTREVLEASMYDAIDYGTYAKSGKLVMSESKFVEVFLRRFAESVNNSKGYTINFYDIHEYPPKATVTITTQTGTETVASDDVNINITTYLNAILETTYKNVETRKISTNINESIIYYDVGKYNSDYLGYETTQGSGTLNNGDVVELSFRFLSDNDSCGYYVTKVSDKIILSKNEIETTDKVYEYCYVKKEDTSNYYFVRKENLTKTTNSNSTE